MDEFYTTILSIAAVILILMLTYVGILLYYSKSSSPFPPYQNDCPDLWAKDVSGKCVFPKSSVARNRGTIAAGAAPTEWKITETNIPGLAIDDATKVSTIDFGNAGWASRYGKTSALCNQKFWSELNNITWDGVSNSNQC